MFYLFYNTPWYCQKLKSSDFRDHAWNFSFHVAVHTQTGFIFFFCTKNVVYHTYKRFDTRNSNHVFYKLWKIVFSPKYAKYAPHELISKKSKFLKNWTVEKFLFFFGDRHWPIETPCIPRLGCTFFFVLARCVTVETETQSNIYFLHSRFLSILFSNKIVRNVEWTK